jgi:twitching motility two-component system response regulator PilG
VTPPTPQESAPAVGAGAVLKVLVKGFSPMEQRLLEGTVKLSQRRPPRIDLLEESDSATADVVMIDAQDPQALQWATAQPWLAVKPVIWAGAKSARPGHVVIDRHVKWPILPVLLYRAIEQGPRAAVTAATEAAPARPTNRRVLIVDDSLAVRAHLRSLLERQGIEVVDADSAEAGIAAASNELFACVLMDVLMPGIDGFEACRRIKARARTGAALPVVMLTSKSSPFDRVRGKMAGCDTYLTKPVNPAELNEVVARHIAAPLVARGASFHSPRTTTLPLKGHTPWPATF